MDRGGRRAVELVRWVGTKPARGVFTNTPHFLFDLHTYNGKIL